MTSAILFDFDYTLADSSKGAVECMNNALQTLGHTPRDWDTCCATIGLSLPDTYRALTGKTNPEEEKRFSDLFIARADQIMAANTTIYDGVPDLLQRLNGSGYTLGIFSTKFRYRICHILDRYALTGQFSMITGGEDVKAHKPNPEGLRLFLAKMGLEAAQIVFVGDSLTDAKTAQQGNVDFIAVLTGTTTADQFADYAPRAILEAVTDIEPHLARKGTMT